MILITTELLNFFFKKKYWWQDAFDKNSENINSNNCGMIFALSTNVCMQKGTMLLNNIQTTLKKECCVSEIWVI